MTIFSDEVLMLHAAEMEEWYEHELIMRAEKELRVRYTVGGPPTPPIGAPAYASLIPWVGFAPAQFNIVNGQNFSLDNAGITNFYPGGWGVTDVTGGLATVTAGLMGPDGTLTASAVIENTSFGNHRLSYGNGFQLGGPQAGQSFDIPFRVQVIAKAAGRNRMVIQITDPFNSDQVSVGCNLLTGQIGYDNSTTNWTIQAATIIQPFGNSGFLAGWWLITVDFTRAGPNNTSTGADVFVYLDNGSGTAARSVSYTGDGNSGILLWYFVFLPKAAWNFTGETFRDDFTTLTTIDVNNTRSPGFNWYVRNHWPNTSQTTACWFTSGVTPAADITQPSRSVVQIAKDPGNCGFGLVSMVDSIQSGNPDIFGNLFNPSFILDGTMAYDASIVGNAAYSGSHPAFWLISRSIALPDITKTCEIDIADGGSLSAVTQGIIDNVLGSLMPGSAGPGPTSLTDFRQYTMMIFQPSAATNNHGFGLSFYKTTNDARTINSLYTSNNSFSKQWTSSANLATQPWMMLLGAGIGTLSGVPINYPVAFDYVRVIK